VIPCLEVIPISECATQNSAFLALEILPWKFHFVRDDIPFVFHIGSSMILSFRIVTLNLVS